MEATITLTNPDQNQLVYLEYSFVFSHSQDHGYECHAGRPNMPEVVQRSASGKYHGIVIFPDDVERNGFLCEYLDGREAEVTQLLLDHWLSDRKECA